MAARGRCQRSYLALPERQLIAAYRGDSVSPIYAKSSVETFGDTPLTFARQRWLRRHGARQWYQSPAELDFDKELHLPRARGRHETCLVRLGTYGSLAPPFGEGGC